MWQLLALAGCLFVCYVCYPASDYFKKGRKLPGPTPLPIVGNLFNLLYYYFKGADQLDALKSIVQEYNGFATLWLANTPTVLVSKPEYVKDLLANSTMVDRPDQYRTVNDVMGSRAVFASSGDVWKETRKQLKQSFEVTSMEIFFDNFQRVSEFLINELDKVAHGEETKVWLTLRLTLTHVLFLNVLGIDQPNEFLEDIVGNDIQYTLEQVFTRRLSILERFDAIYKLMPNGKRYFRSCHKVYNWLDSLITQIRNEYQKLLKNEETVPNIWMYNMFAKFPERDQSLLREDLQTLLIAGLDTTSGVLGYALLMMGLHPELQEKMYEEAVAVRELTGGREIIENDLKHYEFTDRFIRETLRMFPIGELVGRKLHKDIYFGEHLVPKDVDVIALLIVTFRDPELWPNPLKFDPDRFLPENLEKIVPFSYLPFSYGRRICPGQRYAMCALKTFLSKIVLKFHIGTTYRSIQEVIDHELAGLTLYDGSLFPCKITRR